MKEIYLYPGQLRASHEPAQIATILGSCVAIALFDAKTKTGGLNHYLLPNCMPGEKPSPRYGEFAIPALFKEMVALGCNPKDIKAKVYGGGNVVSNISIGQKVGEKNVEFALKTLAEMGVPIVERNIGGTSGRKIKLNTETFEVSHSFMSDRDNDRDTSGSVIPRVASHVKVLIVDDSVTIRNLFQKIFTKHGLHVVGTAVNPYEAREMIVKTKPDVVTLDIEMPEMSGVAFLEKLMKHMPIPTIMVSSLSADGSAALKSLDLGAVEFIHKPSQFDTSILTEFGEMLVHKVRAAASVDVNRLAERARTTVKISPQTSATAFSGHSKAEIKVIGVGGNTGSQNSLVKFLSSLAADTPPVVVSNAGIVEFIEAFISKIKKDVKLDLKIATQGMPLSYGNVYFAPRGFHTTIKKSGASTVIELKNTLPVLGVKPSSDVLLSSVADVFGEASIGVLLGGFGADGVDGLLKVRGAGGTTIVENPDETKFPHGPQRAIANGAADQVLSAELIGKYLLQVREWRAA